MFHKYIKITEPMLIHSSTMWTTFNYVLYLVTIGQQRFQMRVQKWKKVWGDAQRELQRSFKRKTDWVWNGGKWGTTKSCLSSSWHTGRLHYLFSCHYATKRSRRIHTAFGISGAAAPTWMASYGANLSNPRRPSPTTSCNWPDCSNLAMSASLLTLSIDNWTSSSMWSMPTATPFSPTWHQSVTQRHCSTTLSFPYHSWRQNIFHLSTEN